jgi:hypothetical protein
MERQIDTLIAAGWHFIVTNSDDMAFQSWRKHAFDCLTVLLGPEHRYTRHFRDRIDKAGALNILSDVGALSAASLSGSDDRAPCATGGAKGLDDGGGAGAEPHGPMFHYAASSETAKGPHLPSSRSVSPQGVGNVRR